MTHALAVPQIPKCLYEHLSADVGQSRQEVREGTVGRDELAVISDASMTGCETYYTVPYSDDISAIYTLTPRVQPLNTDTRLRIPVCDGPLYRRRATVSREKRWVHVQPVRRLKGGEERVGQNVAERRGHEDLATPEWDERHGRLGLSACPTEGDTQADQP